MGHSVRHKVLTQRQFIQAVDLARANRAELSGKCPTWASARDYLLARAQEAGITLPLTESSIKSVCDAADIRLERLRRVQPRADVSSRIQDALEILTRAVAHLYEKHNEPMSEGMWALLQSARRHRLSDESGGGKTLFGVQEKQGSQVGE